MLDTEQATARLADLLRTHIRAQAESTASVRVGGCGNLKIGAHSQVTIHIDCPLAAELLKILGVQYRG